MQQITVSINIETLLTRIRHNTEYAAAKATPTGEAFNTMAAAAADFPHLLSYIAQAVNILHNAAQPFLENAEGNDNNYTLVFNLSAAFPANMAARVQLAAENFIVAYVCRLWAELLADPRLATFTQNEASELQQFQRSLLHRLPPVYSAPH